MRKTVLSIAGSDSSGGAGIQADVLAIRAAGLHAATAITSITAQNTRGVIAVWPLPPEAIRSQIEAVLSDLEVAAIKLGMLGSVEAVEVVAEAIAVARVPHVVVDPVLVSTSGSALLPDAGVEILIRRLLPWATVVTPNAPELQRLTGCPVTSIEQAESAGRELLRATGVAAVVVKGGHLPLGVLGGGAGGGAREARAGVVDLLMRRGEPALRYVAPHHATAHTHGTGCIFAASLAAHLARGEALHDAVVQAKAFVSEAIRCGVAVGAGRGPADAGFGFLEFCKRQTIAPHRAVRAGGSDADDATAG